MWGRRRRRRPGAGLPASGTGPVILGAGTGRCGTMTLARVLDAHPELDVGHERTPELVELSTRAAHGSATDEDVCGVLSRLFSRMPANRGEVNHRLWPLVGHLHRVGRIASSCA